MDRPLYLAAVVTIFILSSFSSPILRGQRLDVCHTSTHMMWALCEFTMQVWNVLHAARWKYRTQKLHTKNRHLRTIAQLCLAISSQLKHISSIAKRVVKQEYLLYMSSQYGELRPTNGWDQLVSLGHPSKFQRVSRAGFVTAATSLNGGQPNFARCLAIFWPCTLSIDFLGAVVP